MIRTGTFHFENSILSGFVERVLCRTIGCCGPLARWFSFGHRFCSWWNFDRRGA